MGCDGLLALKKSAQKHEKTVTAKKKAGTPRFMAAGIHRIFCRRAHGRQTTNTTIATGTPNQLKRFNALFKNTTGRLLDASTTIAVPPQPESNSAPILNAKFRVEY